MGSSVNSSYFSFVVAGKSFNSKNISSIGSYGNTDGSVASDVNGIIGFTPQSDNTSVSATYNNSLASDGLALGYINYFGINLRCKLAINSQQLLFRDLQSVKAGQVAEFNITNANSNFEVWDITNVCNPQKMTTQFNGTTISFKAKSDSLKQYIIFNNSAFPYTVDIKGEGTGFIQNQDIHGSSVPDMIIIAPTDTGIQSQAQRLANWREQHDGLKVKVVNINQVYNEFSGGRKDVTAIRDMVKMFYDRSTGLGNELKYLLLFGDGTFDNKDEHTGNGNLIPTYESAESLDAGNSYVTDDYFGWMIDNSNDVDNMLEIGIGRISAQDSSEARIVVDKLINYYSKAGFGDWRNKITMVADDGSSNNGDKYFEEEAEKQAR